MNQVAGEMNSVSIARDRPASKVASTLFGVAAGIVLAFCLTGQPAQAYADPGSGAVLWQLFFASIVSIGFHFRKLRQWFTNRWPRRREPTT
jgi:hypothetical protein